MRAIDLASVDLPESVIFDALLCSDGLLAYLKIDEDSLYDLWKEHIENAKKKLAFEGDIDKSFLWHLASSKPYKPVEDIVTYMVMKERLGC